MGEGAWNRQANPVEVLEVWGQTPLEQEEQARAAVQQRCRGCSHCVPQELGEAGLLLRHSRAASHSCCLKRVEGGRTNVQGETVGVFFPCSPWAQVPVQSDLSGSGSTLLFLAADLTLQAVWRWEQLQGCWWVAEEHLLCCGVELV